VKIQVRDRTGGRLREQLSHRHDMVVECTLDDALKIAGALFYRDGLNVMLEHVSTDGLHAILWVDDRALTPRRTGT
jgi:hypothetical protein